MSRAYYNENDPFAASWLRNLIAERLIAPGDVDERSITDVAAGDLDGYTQCHFFAGIGGWSCALRLAGWPDDRAVWTGSCPCQPLSGAGQRKGHADERHLWPAFHGLVAERHPATVFGEQVASADGREWLAGVRADLEALGYAVGAADLCAAGAGAPHIRQRLYWMAHATGERRRQGDGNVPCATGKARAGQLAGRDAAADRLGDTDVTGPQGHRHDGERAGQRAAGSAGSRGSWSDYEIVDRGGGTASRTGPGIFPLADGVRNRVGALRGAGNAIVPEIATMFIRAAVGVRA